MQALLEAGYPRIALQLSVIIPMRLDWKLPKVRVLQRLFSIIVLFRIVRL